MIINLHKPIMVNEILSFIENEKKIKILDCTFGGGGHSQKFLDKGHSVIAIDKDNHALEIAKKYYKKNKNFYFFDLNFKDIDQLSTQKIPHKFNFILLDLGFSSNQLENKDIGLSFQFNSKLNMNYLNGNITAYDVINSYNLEELSRVFLDYGEIFQSRKLAEFIIKNRLHKNIETNFDLIEILRQSGVNFRSNKIHFATKAFQALRIECNGELDNLKTFLKKVHLYLENNSYLVILSFHSLEDRIIKNYFKSNLFSKKKSFINGNDWGYEILTKKPLTPDRQEIKGNNRSRSAKLRVGKFIN